MLGLPRALLRVVGRRGLSTAPALPSFETVAVSSVKDAPGVYEVQLNRPTKANAMNKAMWREIGAAFDALSATSTCRAIVLSGAGKHFTSGLDLMDHADLVMGGGSGSDDVGRRAAALFAHIQGYQSALAALERARQPVIAAVQGLCLGGGVDLICAADIRLATSEATFAVLEASIGLAADVGTLQRLPKIVGSDSWAREVALTARRFTADEAHSRGLLSAVLRDGEALRAHALGIATRIASLSPLAVAGTKLNMNFSRDRTVADGMAFNAAWNAAALQSRDLAVAAEASMRKGAPPSFPDLA